MKKLLIALAVLVVIVVIVIAAVSRRKQSGESVYVAEASQGDVVTVVTGTGVIQARTRVNVSSEIYGQIVELPVKEGDNVKKGDLLVRIDAERYRTDVDRLAANVRVSRIAIEQQEVTLKNLEREQKRAHELYAQEILSSSDLERADLAVDNARINIRSLKESVSQAVAALDRVQTDLTKTKIFAPMSGKVTQVNTEVGEQVIVGTTNIPGSVLMVISDMSEVLAEVSVDETEVVRLKPGQTAKLTVDAVEKFSYEGRVNEIRNTARREGDVNVFGVKILLAAPDDRLRPGMTAKAKIEVARREGVLRIPIQAVTVRERKKLEEDRKAAGGKPQAASATAKDQGTREEGPAAAGSTPRTVANQSGAEATPAGGTNKGPQAVAAKDSGASEGVSAAPAVAKQPGAEEKTAPGQAGSGTSQGGKGAAQSGATGSAAGETSSGAPAAKPGKTDEREEIEVVYLMEGGKAGGTVRAVPVKTGPSDETWVEVVGGIKKGDTVVTGPYRVLKKLKDGDHVIKKEEKEPGESAGEESGGNGQRRGGD
jgi:HlyD family secretion protein